MPDWSPNMPPRQRSLPATRRDGAAAVYFTACVNRIFGRAGERAQRFVAGGDGRSVGARRHAVVDSRRHRRPLLRDDLALQRLRRRQRDHGEPDVESLWRWSDEGRLPIVCDASSCSLGIASEIGPYLTTENRERHAALTILDSVAWAHDRLLPRLDIPRKQARRLFTRAARRFTSVSAEKLHAIAAALAERAITPAAAGCCAFAGDRGFLHPELTRSATRRRRRKSVQPSSMPISEATALARWA